ncbi:MAG: hypothetical protein WCB27_13075 [Thermoguttaceae bacterium]
MPIKLTRSSICFAFLLLGILAQGRADTPNNGVDRDRSCTIAVPADVLADWRAQDGLTQGKTCQDTVAAIARELGTKASGLQTRLRRLEDVPAEDPSWQRLYRSACLQRRTARLQTLLKKWPRIVFTKHYDLGGSHYAYTEGQSDAQNERVFAPGASLCLLTLSEPVSPPSKGTVPFSSTRKLGQSPCSGLFGQVRTLVDDPGGVLRDPDVSYDGKKVLFAWKKSLDKDDYHLYEFDAATGRVRQLTSGLGFADYEGIYAPNGQIIFSSTRCVQTVDCWWTEVSNLYTCDRDGRFLRRLGFDQVHTNFPTVLPDGRIVYTRWEYSDRGQMFPQGLFQMNPDGTGQTEYYGNNSWFPTSMLHARGIPETDKVMAIFSGHHTLQKGWLGIVDPSRGRQENAGAQLIAPPRKTAAERIDAYGQSGDQFQYPYPLSETEFLVSFKPAGATGPFAIYWMDTDGRRELLAADERISCNQPVPLAARPLPHVRPNAVDYRKKLDLCYMQDIYLGEGLRGVPRGAVKKLRVVALDYRAAGVGNNENAGPDGEALVCTPVSIGNGAWDVKIVLGETKVHEDGSAFFEVPARTPVYFQAIDEKGRAIQTMRSWATFQPGEVASCVGCHENKNAAPPVGSSVPLALREDAEQLDGFYGPPRGFSFRSEIQPILNRHCTVCHKEPPSETALPLAAAARSPGAHGKLGDTAFSLLDTEVLDPVAKRKWSQAYLALTASRRASGIERSNTYRGDPHNPLVNWISAQSSPAMLPAYSAGAAKSRLMTLLEQGHGGVELSREETDKIACWIDLLVPFCGDYLEANTWSQADLQTYSHFLDKRKRMEEVEQRNIEELIRTKPK